MSVTKDIPTVNGVELSDKSDVVRAFSHLGKDYNDGEIYPNAGLDGNTAVLVFRNSRPEYWSQLTELVASGRIEVVPEATNDGRLKIEVRDA